MFTGIDVITTMKKKLDGETPPYRILGAGNPFMVHQGMTNVLSIGLLLSCNVIVRQEENEIVHVEFMNSASILSLMGNPAVGELPVKRSLA